MNSVLFAKMDQVFSLKKQNIKKYWKSRGVFVSLEKWEPCFFTEVI